MTTLNITEVLEKTDWAQLARQKATLIALAGRDGATDEEVEHLEGLLSFLDYVQDAAAEAGFPVVWLGENGFFTADEA